MHKGRLKVKVSNVSFLSPGKKEGLTQRIAVKTNETSHRGRIPVRSPDGNEITGLYK